MGSHILQSSRLVSFPTTDVLKKISSGVFEYVPKLSKSTIL